MLHNEEDDQGPAQRAAPSLCLASQLPVLRLMASLASLRVGSGPSDPYQLPHLITSQQLPVYIGQLAGLSSLDLSGCGRLKQLPDTIGQLAGLSRMYLRNCSRLQQLPNTIGQLTALARQPRSGLLPQP
jgi:hypothetical protein